MGFRWLRFGQLDIGLALGFFTQNAPVPGLFHHWFLCLVECLAQRDVSDSKPRWPLRIIWLVIGGFTYVGEIP